LVEFGKAQDPSLMNDDAVAYKFGVSQFKPDRTVIKAWLDKELKFHRFSLHRRLLAPHIDLICRTLRHW